MKLEGATPAQTKRIARCLHSMLKGCNVKLREVGAVNPHEGDGSRSRRESEGGSKRRRRSSAERS
eukprot:scaffold120534_cov27-Phaeocystis_antarctica.AAC.1